MDDPELAFRGLKSKTEKKQVCPYWRRGGDSFCLKMDCPLLHRELNPEEDEKDMIEADCLRNGAMESLKLVPGEWYVAEVTSC